MQHPTNTNAQATSWPVLNIVLVLVDVVQETWTNYKLVRTPFFSRLSVIQKQITGIIRLLFGSAKSSLAEARLDKNDKSLKRK